MDQSDVGVAGRDGPERSGAGEPEVGVRRRQGRRRKDHLQLHPGRAPRRSPAIGSDNLHRPSPQPQRRLPAEVHQDPHSRQWLLQPLRHGRLGLSLRFRRRSRAYIVL